KRICRRLGLFRRKNQTDLPEVLTFVQREITTTGQLQGYRWLHLRAVQLGFVVSQDTIRRIIKLANPEGVELRRARRGPNALWHVDGYDKLKPSGCIDGFSRYVFFFFFFFFFVVALILFHIFNTPFLCLFLVSF
ncbi:hypothetical protein LDENG_00273040, partial [Lucifuga dentata]